MLRKHSHSAASLGKALFPIFALALDLPEHFFDDKVCQVLPSNIVMFVSHTPCSQTQHSAGFMKLLHYPPQTGPFDERTIGIGAHTE